MPDTKDKSLGKRLDKIAKRLDMIVVILLARSGLNRKQIADILGISEKTIERMLPFREIKQSRKEE
jgi:transposase